MQGTSLLTRVSEVVRMIVRNKAVEEQHHLEARQLSIASPELSETIEEGSVRAMKSAERRTWGIDVRATSMIVVLFCSASFPAVALTAEVNLTGKRGPVRMDTRTGLEEEIKKSRGKVEDELRARVLGSFWRDKQIASVQDYLNRPWDEEAIGYLWSVVEHSSKGDDFLRIGVYPNTVIPNILNLLAYVHTSYRNEELCKAIADRFDSLFVQLREGHEDCHRYLPSYLYQSIDKYGTASLLGPGFWEGMEPAEGSLAWLGLLERIGDDDTLEKLQNMKEGVTDEDLRKKLDKAITNIGRRLDGKPPIHNDPKKLVEDLVGAQRTRQ